MCCASSQAAKPRCPATPRRAALPAPRASPELISGRIGKENRIVSARRWRAAAARTRSMVRLVSSIVAAGSTNTSACRAATLIAVPESPAKAIGTCPSRNGFGPENAPSSRWKRPSWSIGSSFDHSRFSSMMYSSSRARLSSWPSATAPPPGGSICTRDAAAAQLVERGDLACRDLRRDEPGAVLDLDVQRRGRMQDMGSERRDILAAGRIADQQPVDPGGLGARWRHRQARSRRCGPCGSPLAGRRVPKCPL